MDLFKEKMETWEGKLVRLKTDCRTGEHIYPKGLLMKIDCVSTKKSEITNNALCYLWNRRFYDNKRA